MMNLETRVQLHPNVRYRTIGDEGIVLHQQTAEVLVINQVGNRTLELMNDQTTPGGLVDALIEEYTVERTVLERDVLGFLQELLTADVISVRPGQAP